MKQAISFTIERELLDRIDQQRRLIPRSRFLEKIISENIGGT